jgi:hypothetical protein
MMDSDEQTRRLLRLLALKRFETPPPGFFQRFPDRVLVSIRAGTEMESASWWERFYTSILREPIVAGSYAALGVGALLFGISVFQVAVEREGPAFAGLDGVASAAPGILPLAPAANLPAGVIYRVPHLSSPSDATLVPLHLSTSPSALLEVVERNNERSVR